MGKNLGVLVTFPSELCRTGPAGSSGIGEWTTKLGWIVDALFELKGFGGESARALISIMIICRIHLCRGSPQPAQSLLEKPRSPTVSPTRRPFHIHSICQDGLLQTNRPSHHSSTRFMDSSRSTDYLPLITSSLPHSNTALSSVYPQMGAMAEQVKITSDLD